jgi:FMN phosphatase YigB (HAD superfamily)
MKTIIWDVDDVLNDFMRVWFDTWRAEHSHCAFSYDDLRQNPPYEVLGITMEEYLQSLDTFRQTGSYKDMVPKREVTNWFVQNGYRFHHSVLTAVPLRAAPTSAQWVFRHFGTWIRTFHFVPSRRTGEIIPEYDQNKAELLKRMNAADLFIDDNVFNIESAREAGINVLVFPRPWNENAVSCREALDQIDTLLA